MLSGVEKDMSRHESLLSRRQSSRLAELERTSSTLTPSLSWIGAGGSSFAVCAPIGASSLGPLTHMASMSGLASAASRASGVEFTTMSDVTADEDDGDIVPVEDVW